MSTPESAVRARLSEVLTQRGAEIADRWVQLQEERTGTGQESLAEAEWREEADLLVEAVRACLAGDVPLARATEHAGLNDAVVDMSMRRARAGAAPTEASLALFALKEAVLEAVRQEPFGTEELYVTVLAVNRVLDAASALCFETFVHGREEIIRRQSRQLLEASTPVVRLWRHVLAVPLIGNLDTARSQVVMENLLEAIQKNGTLVAIIDITGVPTVDTSVAQHLIQTVKAVRLMGAECVVSGVRPAIAQTIVQLGIDLSDILTRATLADALETSMRLTQQEAFRSEPGIAPGWSDEVQDGR